MPAGDWDALELISRHPAERFAAVEVSADPAAGQVHSHVIPGGEAWLLHGALFSLVTDVNVADRHVRLQVSDGNLVFARIPAGAVQAAGLTRRYTFGGGTGAAWAAGLDVAAPLPAPPLLLLPGFIITTAVDNLQAGDDASAMVLRLERTILRGLAAEVAYELALTMRELAAQDRAAERLLR